MNEQYKKLLIRVMKLLFIQQQRSPKIEDIVERDNCINEYRNLIEKDKNYETRS